MGRKLRFDPPPEPLTSGEKSPEVTDWAQLFKEVREEDQIKKGSKKFQVIIDPATQQEYHRYIGVTRCQ